MFPQDETLGVMLSPWESSCGAVSVACTFVFARHRETVDRKDAQSTPGTLRRAEAVSLTIPVARHGGVKVTRHLAKV